ncbi:tyrosine-type recombinase/integrase [Methanonatronarchaeum sp. AMET-Sl]|uniref:tyrosine-type recombinase/integrase n=1 Tax=Methanonatronarchaeum sp. AMET-Sl TaxID=3037654 RepID=UPI00244DCC8A|nr:tyrosine-type recombinase/integrase [Methanonatronarchaeum sp. AMET-Sl]WGI17685.1 tyrosine-type recombinase/integrase [Methanonatronarchaeum sp. AMET-Sl]
MTQKNKPKQKPENKNQQNQREKKQFGKFKQGQQPLRQFEKNLKIKARKGTDAWKSKYKTIQRFLNHYARQTKSMKTRKVYLRTISRYTKHLDIEPDQLTQQTKEAIEQQLEDYRDQLLIEEKSRRYINSEIKRIESFYRTNNKDIEIDKLHIPTRYRKKQEYIPTKHEVHQIADAANSNRDRTIILSLWSSGLRINTLLALNIKDIQQELKQDHEVIKLPVYPEMKQRLEGACKGKIPYYSFICKQATKALKTYLNERKTKYGELKPEHPLFHSEWNQYENRNQERVTRSSISRKIKKAAKHAEIDKHQHISPHTLRKAFKSQLRTETETGEILDRGTQEFFMGHVLPGSEDPYYDKTKTKYHRKQYKKIDFTTTPPTEEKDKIIEPKKLQKHLNKGWKYIEKINENQIIIRKKQ